MKIKNKIVLGIAASGTALALIPMFAAFEAHVISVTARIENALSVDTSAIEFGTVFPQEHLLSSGIQVTLSESFLEEGRVDDIDYVIKQKPKVKEFAETGDPHTNPTPRDPYAIIQVGAPYNFNGPAWQFCEENLPLNAPYSLTEEDLDDIYWQYCYLPLANYLSKTEDTTDGEAGENDTSIPAFHQAYVWNNGSSTVNTAFIAHGRLAKSEQDQEDSWIIDLAVPCFVGHCAQDWATFVNGINPDADPNAFMLPEILEHLVFGTDLWIEVTGVSRTDEELDSVGALINSSTYDEPICDHTASTTIQNAVNFASPGQTVCVPDGTYNENVTINKNLTLAGENAPTATALVNGVIEITANDVTVKGLKITGAVSTAPDFAGIYIWANTSGHTISDNIIDGTDAVGSRGILFGYDVSNVLVTNNVISDWHSGSYINPTTAGNIDFTFNDFDSNAVGIGSDSITDVDVNHNEFDSNTAEAIGLGDFERNTSGVVINMNNFIPAGGGNNVNAYELNGSFEVLATDATDNWWDTEVEASRTNDPAIVDTEPVAAGLFPHN